jgi:hypothetical protein
MIKAHSSNPVFASPARIPHPNPLGP